MRNKEANKSPDIWLYLRFSYLALNCVGVRFGSEDKPAAIVELQKIVQANSLAQQNGIKPEQAVEQAQMLNSELKIIERQSDLEAEKLNTLCAWAYRYTSHISVYNTHTLLLEIGRSLAFFKGISSMQNLILADLERLAVDAQYGLANTPKAAHLLSFGSQQQWQCHDSKNALKQSRLEHLAIPEKTLTQLKSCGFSLLKDITVIPKMQLGARFGKPFILYLDQLMGKAADPQNLHCTPEKFNASIDFAEPISNRIWIQQQIDRLLNDLLTFTNSRQLICRSLTWKFFNENNRLAQSITIGLNMSTLKLRNLQELTELKLSTLALKWTFSNIELSSEELIPKNLFHQDLFNPTADQEEFNQLTDKLSSRLGNTAIYKLAIADEHLPEFANERCYFSSQAVSKTMSKAMSKTVPKNTSQKVSECSHSEYTTQNLNQPGAEQLSTEQQDEPTWLLRTPQKLSTYSGQPEHNGALTFIHGPNRISSHWWQALQSRDYYIARQSTGRLLWVYYERSQKNWYLHGLYG